MQYGIPVLLGQVEVCRLTYLAVQRHYEDLRDGAERGLRFDPGAAQHVISFIERFFVHTQGRQAGRPLLLDPWQRFWSAVLYGWRRADTGLRRFTRGYEEVPRKNGKSTWKSPQGIYMLMCDGEPGAEVYALATTREQAMKVFRPAFDNVRRWRRVSPKLARSLKVYEAPNQEKVTLGSGVFKPLPAVADTLDGLNPAAVLFDELHAQRARDVWDVIESALGARQQPLLTAITTAGYVLDGICTEMRAYLVSVLEGKREDDAFFGYVYTLDDPGKEAMTERGWRKANPGLGTIKQLDYMRTQARRAAALPSAQANFLTKDLNVWGGGAEGWFDMLTWDKGGARFDPEMLRGRDCYGGLDLASVRDLVALVLLFPPPEEGGEWHLLAQFWCPAAKVDEKGERDDAAPYGRWVEQGWLTATPGDVTDYAPVERAIVQAQQDYNLIELGFDRWNAQQLCNNLTEQHGTPVVDVPQNTGGMYPGAKLIEQLVYGRRLRHGGNPVLRYCADNVTLLFDSNDCFRPDKRRSRPNGRIDGIVAACMAASRAVAIRLAKYDGDLDYS